MGKVGLMVLGVICFTVVWLYNQFQVNPVRNKMVFENKIETVADSVARMDALMIKISRTGTNGYFLTNEGYLYFNSEKIGPIKGAINNPKIRKDMAFEHMSDQEINSFFYIMAFLLKNHIDGGYKHRVTGQYVYNYRRTAENSYDDLREILFVRSQQDTLSSEFRNTYQILDQKSNLVLIAPKKAQIR